MNSHTSEGHASALQILATVPERRTEPTRHLYSGGKYTPSHATNIARTFRKARLLARLQGAK